MKNIVLLLLAVLTIGNISYAGFPVTERKVTIFIDSKCDNIILKDGSEISAKIVEITPDLIKYRKCNNLDGPLFSINTNDVLLIRYLDGTKEVFKVNNNSDTRYTNGEVLNSFRYFVDIAKTNAPPKIVRIFMKDERLSIT